MNKTRYFLYSLLISFILLTGCSKDLLELEPQGILLEKSYFNNEDDVWMALISAYDPISWVYSWGMSHWVTLNAASDDANCGGEFTGDRPEYQEPDRFNISVTNDGPEQLWRKYYAGIYRCNLLILNVTDKPEIITPKVNQYVAETRFLRAYYYFDLVRFFGDVPLIDHPLGSSEYSLSRSPVSEIFDFIVNDLTLAISDLPVNEEMKGRATKGAAMALLGKVYLFMSSPYYNLGNHYQDAADMFAQVISLGKYELLENYRQNFDRDYNYGKESIFELGYTASIGVDWDASNPYPRMEGNIDWQLCGIRNLVPSGLFEPGWGFVKPTQDIANAYMAENDTVRYNASIISGDSLTSLGYTWIDNFDYEGYFRMKYNIMTKDIPENSQAWDNNNRIIRLADVYLMIAECIVNGASDPDGQNADFYVNLVRQRVKLPAKSGVTMEDIMLERRLEFSFEALRYWDVLRWNKGDEVFGNHKTSDVEYQWNPVKKGLWPVPQTEILRTNGSLKQNPGY
ncbi:MAG: RagB/SusD family nutrient uptake outer membrane protein [Bacteroidales bacterium]|nr:RagB/SusD family nutrient uptake outer membrane protein [Bacteroidales bacterium]